MRQLKLTFFQILFLLLLLGCVDNTAVQDSLTVEETVTVNDDMELNTDELVTAVTAENANAYSISGTCTSSSNSISVVTQAIEETEEEAAVPSVDLTTADCTDGSFTATIDFSATSLDGRVTLVVAEVSGESTVSSISFSIFVDVTVPTVVTGFSAADTLNPLKELTVTFSEEVNIDYTLISLTNAEAAAFPSTEDGLTYTFTLFTDTDGAVAVSIPEGAVSDDAGNVLAGSIDANWTFTSPPGSDEPTAIALTSPDSANTSENDLTIDVTVTAIEGQIVNLYNADSQIDCVDDNLITSVTTDTTTATFELTDVAEGAYTYRALAYTVSGAAICSSVSLDVSVDQTAPTLLGLVNDPVAQTSKTWSWACDDSCNYRYVVDQTSTTNPSGDYSSTSIASLNGQAGLYYIHVQAQDEAGNESEVVHASVVMVASTKTPPGGLTLTTVDEVDNDASPDIDVAGVDVGDTIRLYSDSFCSSLVGTKVADATTITITSGTLSEGEYEFHATADDGTETSICSTASVSYTYTPVTEANSISLVAPATDPSSDSTPEFAVSVTAATSQTVRLYAASTVNDCTSGNLLGSGSGDGSTINVTVSDPFTTTGNYTIRAVTVSSLGAEMPCSTASTTYYYDIDGPSTPTVTGLDADSNAVRGPTTYFNTSTDSDSGISHYEMAISSFSDATVAMDILDWTDIGTPAGSYQLITAQDGALDMTAGSTYYVHVKAVDNADNESTAATSASFIANFSAYNLGGATANSIATMDASNSLVRNGSALTTLSDAGDTYSFVGAEGDEMLSEKPFYVAGAYLSAQNVTWMPADWSGTEFSFINSRSGTSSLKIYSFTNANVTITVGGAAYDTEVVTAGTVSSVSISQNATTSYEVVSDVPVLLYHSANTDPFAILPVSNEVIGTNSIDNLISVSADSDVDALDGDGVTDSVSLTVGDIGTVTTTSNNYFNEVATLLTADTTKMACRTESDSPGGQSSVVFVPTSMFKTRYVVNVETQFAYVATTNNIGSVTITPPGGSATPVSLSGSGPYHRRLTNLTAGTVIEGSAGFAAWYEPKTNTDAVDNGETLMFGAD